jgi:hypothetical protein
MKGIFVSLLLALLLSLILACSANSATAKADMGYIRITGHVEKIRVNINDVEQYLDFVRNDTALIEIPAGNYKIEIFRNNESILKQKLIVSNSVTTEVVVP